MQPELMEEKMRILGVEKQEYTGNLILFWTVADYNFIHETDDWFINEKNINVEIENEKVE